MDTDAGGTTMHRPAIRLDRRSLAALVAAIAVSTGGSAQAASPPIYTPSSGLALGGHDPVAYFTDGRQTAGSTQFETTWQGARWRFASQENLEKFRGEPERYAPQYGGYCAWAIGARNSLAPGDARYWRIVDGKLYVNYDASVQRQWVRDIPGFIAAADRNWPAILTR
jgi:YHS domain-containing protein